MAKEYLELVGQSNRQLIQRELYTQQVTSCGCSDKLLLQQKRTHIPQKKVQVHPCNPLLLLKEKRTKSRPAQNCDAGCNILLKGGYF
jgi:hypothetical protein